MTPTAARGVPAAMLQCLVWFARGYAQGFSRECARSTGGLLRPVWLGILAVGMALGGCSSLESLSEINKVDYRGAVKAPSLEVPPDLIRPSGGERFAALDRPAEVTLSGFQAGRAGAGVARQVLPAVSGARIERETSGRTVLVVDAPIEKAWPLVKNFWQASGFNFVVDRADIGILETDWVENRARIPQDFIRRMIGRVVDGLYSSGERDKYRTRLDARSVTSTEIVVTHRGMVEVSLDMTRTQWQPRANDPELEIEFIRRMLIMFGDTDGVAREKTAPMLPVRATPAVGGAAPALAELQREGQVDTLVLAMNFDRAWRQVGLALDRGGFTVEDRDRSKGIYYVRYIDPGIDRESPRRGMLDSVTAIFRSAVAQTPRQYRVQIKGQGESTRIVVVDAKGENLRGDEQRQVAESMLKLLREQLR
jgi:outer membrane protein assembly factor BamC